MSLKTTTMLPKRTNTILTLLLEQGPDLEIRLEPGNQVAISVTVPAISPDQIFTQDLLDSRDPFTNAAITQFMDNMNDAAILEAIKRHRRPS